MSRPAEDRERDSPQREDFNPISAALAALEAGLLSDGNDSSEDVRTALTTARNILEEVSTIHPVNVESKDHQVVCGGCGTARPATEMNATADTTITRNDGAVLQVQRFYLCGAPECANQFSGDDPDCPET